MQTDPIVQCPNYFCQALNPVTQEFCHHCQTRIPKRYLWVMGVKAGQPGERLDDRYLLKSSQIVLDTKPGIPPNPVEVPPQLEPYLHLMAERPTIPQPYAVLSDLILLESAPITTDGQLMPALTQVWNASSGFRQLHFLEQITRLWQRLSVENVASTLLDPNQLFADGDTLRLLELRFDRQSPALTQLGELWTTWQPHSAISDFFQQICQNLVDGEISSIESLISVLDQAIAHQAQYQTRQIHIATATDQGPSRQSNEDACYPPSATKAKTNLVIVCDGIGGHEGGEVASHLAIETIARQVQAIQSDEIEQELEAAVCEANDAISEQNDAERRQERQRMGTTVVMGLVRGHEFYLTHVGDSRAYRITRKGCYQVTLDDDVASREARLGYSLYRDALQRSSAGSLVQALGMGSSSYLRPTVQRLILDEDCVYLLCSDGLSDNDRVEEVWQTEIAPILDGKIDVAVAAQQLINIANTRNGHDNVTVGLIHCQTKESRRSQNAQTISPALAQPTQMLAAREVSQLRTQIAEPRRINWFKVLFIVLALFGIAGAIATLLAPELIARFTNRMPVPSATVPPVPASPTVTPLTSGSFIQIQTADQTAGLPLFKNAAQSTETANEILGRMSSGTVLQVVGQQRSTSDQSNWLRLKVCTLPTEGKLVNSVRLGNMGWQRESAIANFTRISPKPDQIGACAESAAESAKENPSATP
ncbi:MULTISPECIES: PP2C family protein-serine/threonine phosphatase [Leptolyngbya]|uniref:PP2C family protein-serine/threonine phosphatase n=1 Tax=Leptolyngbya TaxID=47251 RepID=UPI00168412D1|nr:protein phosphatase 2C domain-containing protein [Leptolyngbya sp. FACHB-1624]MBD1855120.1 protein phosphatase 2C domain-containing protein [Leptolyngbya sp. FACHB-1624]